MFPQELFDPLGYYVYRLIDPRNGETFYVGKGRANRVFAHASGVVEVGDDPSEKMNRIRAIQLAGFDVAHVIHRHGLDEATAFEVEAAVMEAYPGITNIVGGHASDARGVVHADELRRRYTAELVRFEHQVILLTVNALAVEENLYEATRFAWRLDVRKAQQADYVLPVVKGVIKGAYVAEQWLSASEDNFPGKMPMSGRWGFVGREAPAGVVEHYLQKRLPAEMMKRGAANPVRYATPDLVADPFGKP